MAPPPHDYVKINSDAAFCKEKNLSCSGIVARDSKGTVITGCYKVVPASSPLQAEALALREAVSFAVKLGISSVIFESDNLELIQACRQDIQRGKIKNIVEDMLLLKGSFHRSGFTWTPREGNEVAHLVASLASKKALFPNWSWCPSLCLREALRRDASTCV